MMFTVDEIASATGGRIAGNAGLAVESIASDSRTARPGQLFVALRGERFNGHDFIATAAAAGITVFLIEEAWAADHPLPPGTAAVLVADTLHALGDLASWHRSRFDLPVVAVTGSNGKTTTKEMVAAILGVGGPGLKTSGNLNNLIGLPLTLFGLEQTHRWAVLEMGMSEPGEIDRLAAIARPLVGVITNVGAAHLASMGSLAAVALAKGELFLRLPVAGWAICNADDPLGSCCPAPEGVRRLSFGLQGGDVTATNLRLNSTMGEEFTLHLPDGREGQVRLGCVGRHNVANALAAAAVAHALGIGIEQICAGLAHFTPPGQRFAIEEVGNIKLIDDSYNANPASMAAALMTLREIRGSGRSIAVLGDMLELGESSSEAHRQLGRLAASCVDRLYLLGEMAGTVAEGAVSGGLAEEAIIEFGSHVEIANDLARRVKRGDLILVKGSRGMRMETVAEAIRHGFVADQPGEEA